MAKKTVLVVDPPSGWKYGFPKPVPDPRPENMIAWFIEQGYPQAEIDACGDHFYSRYWETEVDDWSLTVYDEGDGEWVNKHIESRKKDTDNAI